MSQSTSKLRRGTPYLDDLQSQMGNRFMKIVQREINRFQKRRENLKTKVEEDGSSKAQELLQSLPNALRHTGAYLAGPKTLRRGETTQLPLIVRSGSGKEYVIGHYVVHTTIGGSWQMVGYDSESGIPKEVPHEIRSYEPDDLESAMGTMDLVINKIDQVSGQYLQLDEQRSGGGLGDDFGSGLGGILGGEVEDTFGDDLTISTDSASEKSKSSSSSASKTVYENARRLLGTQRRDGSTKIKNDPPRDLKEEEVAKRLKKGVYRQAAPGWFLKIKNKRPSKPKRWKKFIGLATKIYNRAKKKNATINKFWKAVEKAGRKKGLFNKNYCWETSQEISLENGGKCARRHDCPVAKFNNKGQCKHQSFSP